MSDSQMPNGSASSSRPDATAVMPPVSPGGAPPATPQGTPPRKGLPSWAWALIGALAVVLLLGAFAVGQGVRTRRAATEATATAGIGATSPSNTSDLVTADDSGREVIVTDESAGSASGDSDSSGDAETAGEASTEGGSDTGDSAAEGEADAGAAAEEPIGDAGGEEMVPSEYRSVLKVTGTREYVSAPIRLERGKMELTVHVTRTTHDPMAARVERSGGGSPITWWSTTNAVDGATRTVEMNVPGTASYRFRIECPPGSGWSLRVRWKR